MRHTTYALGFAIQLNFKIGSGAKKGNVNMIASASWSWPARAFRGGHHRNHAKSGVILSLVSTELV